MTLRGRRTSPTLGERIRARHAPRRLWIRARVPLVLLRYGPRRQAGGTPRARWLHVPATPLAVHVHVSWPLRTSPLASWVAPRHRPTLALASRRRMRVPEPLRPAGTRPAPAQSSATGRPPARLGRAITTFASARRMPPRPEAAPPVTATVRPTPAATPPVTATVHSTPAAVPAVTAAGHSAPVEAPGERRRPAPRLQHQLIMSSGRRPSAPRNAGALVGREVMRPPAVRLVTMGPPPRVLPHQAQGPAMVGGAARDHSWRPATSLRHDSRRPVAGAASAAPRAWRRANAAVTTDRPAGPDRRPVLYAQPASRSFAAPPTVDTGHRAPPTATPPPPPPPPSVPRPAPALHTQIDVPRLTEEVYRHLQRKIRIERERRGL
jgi:hypothetical protein